MSGNEKKPADDWQHKWCEAVLTYAADVNAYTRRGYSEGWEGLPDPENIADVSALTTSVMQKLRQANEVGSTDGLSETLPPSHAGLIKQIEKQGQSLVGDWGRHGSPSAYGQYRFGHQ